MLRLEETKFSGSLLDGGFPKSFIGRPYSRYTQSGAYIVTLKEYSDRSNEHYLEVHNSITDYSRIKTLKNGLKSVRNVELVYHQAPQYEDSEKEVNCGDLILIEDKKGEVDIYCLLNGRSLLYNCMVLMGKRLRGACAIKVGKSILILIVMTDSEIFLFSNFYYSSFEPLYQTNEPHNMMDSHINDNGIDPTLKYYRQVSPDFNKELDAFCITSMGKFYFSSFNEIFKLELPPGRKEQSSDFQPKQVYVIDLDGKLDKNSHNFYVTNLIYHETFINGDQFELIYIIHTDENHICSKNLSLLKVRNDSGVYEYHFDKLSTIGGSGGCCHILSYKIFDNGQLGVIWESNDQIYVNVFNHFFNGFQKSSLSYSGHLNGNSFGKKLSNKANHRDLTSLLYGDAPLIYINESEFSSSSQRTNEILKIHGRIFSDSLKVRDIEKEEGLIKNITDSIFVNNTIRYSKAEFICKEKSEPSSDNFPLRNMNQFIFYGVPILFSPVLGIRPNDNVTNLPDDWYSCMSFVINTFTCDSDGNQSIVRVMFTCWYEGIFNYLKYNLHSILKTPQMHLQVLKKLTLLLPESKCSKPTSLWIALNSIKNLDEFQTLDKSDINLFFSIIDLYAKNGMAKHLIDFAISSQTNFLSVLYSWSIHQSKEVISFLKGVIEKNSFDSSKGIFKFKSDNEFLETLVGLSFLTNDCKLFSNFVSNNIKPLKSALGILEFVLDSDTNLKTEPSEKLIYFKRLVLSLLEWKNLFGLICSFKSYIESSSFQFPIPSLIGLAVDSINELSVFEQVVPATTLIELGFTWENVLTLSLLLETFMIGKALRDDILPNLNDNKKSLVSKVDELFTSLFPIQNSCHIFARIVSNSITRNGLLNFISF